jgi:hypothetical protein
MKRLVKFKYSMCGEQMNEFPLMNATSPRKITPGFQCRTCLAQRPEQDRRAQLSRELPESVSRVRVVKTCPLSNRKINLRLASGLLGRFGQLELGRECDSYPRSPALRVGRDRRCSNFQTRRLARTRISCCAASEALILPTHSLAKIAKSYELCVQRSFVDSR